MSRAVWSVDESRSRRARNTGLHPAQDPKQLRLSACGTVVTRNTRGGSDGRGDCGGVGDDAKQQHSSSTHQPLRSPMSTSPAKVSGEIDVDVADEDPEGKGLLKNLILQQHKAQEAERAEVDRLTRKGALAVVAEESVLWGPSGGGNRETQNKKRPRMLMDGKEMDAAFEKSPYTREFMSAWQATLDDSAKERDEAGKKCTSNTEFDTEGMLHAFINSTAPRTLLSGYLFFLNSCDRIDGISRYHFEKLLRYYGGHVSMMLHGGVTHVVTQHLCSAKEAQVKKAKDRVKGPQVLTKYVQPEWVFALIRSGKRGAVREEDYCPSGVQVHRSTLDGMFGKHRGSGAVSTPSDAGGQIQSRPRSHQPGGPDAHRTATSSAAQPRKAVLVENDAVGIQKIRSPDTVVVCDESRDDGKDRRRSHAGAERSKTRDRVPSGDDNDVIIL